MLNFECKKIELVLIMQKGIITVFANYCICFAIYQTVLFKMCSAVIYQILCSYIFVFN